MALSLGNSKSKSNQSKGVLISNQKQFLTFKLGNDNFGVAIHSVREIIECQELQEVPGVNQVIKGVINLRGFGVPIIDLASCIGRPTNAFSKRTCILIAETEFEGKIKDVGFIVDMVNEVLDVAASDIESPVSVGDGPKPQSFLMGMAKTGKEFIILLDLNKALSFKNQEMEILNEVLI
jgi:purine-binding chemotaxis protein CheW